MQGDQQRRATVYNRSGIVDPMPETPFQGLGKRLWSGQDVIADAIETDHSIHGRPEHLIVHVLPMIYHGDGNIARISTDTDIGDILMEGKAIQRRMGPDEPAMALSL